MKKLISVVWSLFVMTLMISIAACSNELSELSRAEHNGLLVEFSVICKEGDIWLASSIENKRAEAFTLETGALPWDYDPLATRFSAFAGRTELQRQGGIPFSDRFAPTVLAPNERKTGATPIGYMFPEIRDALSKESVAVEWKFTDQLHGRLSIKRNPCSTNNGGKPANTY